MSPRAPLTPRQKRELAYMVVECGMTQRHASRRYRASRYLVLKLVETYYSSAERRLAAKGKLGKTPWFQGGIRRAMNRNREHLWECPECGWESKMRPKPFRCPKCQACSLRRLHRMKANEAD